MDEPKAPPSGVYIRARAWWHLQRCREANFPESVRVADFLEHLILKYGGAAALDFKNGTAHGVPVWPEELNARKQRRKEQKR